IECHLHLAFQFLLILIGQAHFTVNVDWLAEIDLGKLGFLGLGWRLDLLAAAGVVVIPIAVTKSSSQGCLIPLRK
ncbi:hypothetical protein, partial [Limosilactobacillus mucosae]|uniref:hypothetical protein n=1 Tax=Limosilactobacillus mucosae TaxID=97478 RepID=UPI003B981667